MFDLLSVPAMLLELLLCLSGAPAPGPFAAHQPPANAQQPANEQQSLPQVIVESLDEPARTGILRKFTDAIIELEQDERTIEVPRASLLSIRIASQKETEPSDPSQLILQDGSRISVREIERSVEQLSGSSTVLGTVRIPSKQVRAIRLQPRNPAYDVQWNSFLNRRGDKDLLIVPKTEGEGLDFLSGIIGSITADEVSMLLDGENFPVPVDRVYGIVFGSVQDPSARAGLQIQSTSGDQISASQVRLDGQKWIVTTAWGEDIGIDSSGLLQIDFSGDRLAYLADLPVVEETFEGLDPQGSPFAGLIDAETARLLYSPRRNTSLDTGSPMRLRGRQYARGLCIHSRTRIVWDLQQEFSTLEFTMGVDDEVAFNQVSRVAIKIVGDDEVLLDKTIATQDSPEPVRVSVAGKTTLTILVDYADGDSSCDWLDLADARLIRKPAEAQK